MVGVRSLFLAATALSSSVLAAFEPLAADDLFGRAAPNFEPLTPSTTRRSVLPRAHHAISARGQSGSSQDSAVVAEAIQNAINTIKPLHSSISSVCSDAKSGKNKNPVSVVSKIQPSLAACKQAVHDCGNGWGWGNPHPHPHPHPSGWPGSGGGGGGGGWPGSGGGGGGGGGWGGSGGCGGLFAELVQILEETFTEVESVDIPLLSSLLEGYVSSIDSDLSDMVNGMEEIVPGVTSSITSLISSITGDLKSSGLTGLLSSLGL